MNIFSSRCEVVGLSSTAIAFFALQFALAFAVDGLDDEHHYYQCKYYKDKDHQSHAQVIALHFDLDRKHGWHAQLLHPHQRNT